ncbi:hypothetical protein Tco_0792976 [Tanacetum coccineum]
MKKAFQDMLHGLGEVNPTHAYCNGSRTSKDNEDPNWSTSFKTRRTQKTSSALEVLYLFGDMVVIGGSQREEEMDGFYLFCMKERVGRYDNTLVGYFVGKSLACPVVEIMLIIHGVLNKCWKEVRG